MAEECARCGRVLKNPESVARGIGPKCWKLVGGGVFDKDLDVGKLEWVRREKLLQDGGEIDLGVNWRYVKNGIPSSMRVSVRYRDGKYEAYGRLLTFMGEEVVFARSEDLKTVYREAVGAGPMSTALAYRKMRTRKKVV
jgi:hypothetical protein